MQQSRQRSIGLVLAGALLAALGVWWWLAGDGDIARIPAGDAPALADGAPTPVASDAATRHPEPELVRSEPTDGARFELRCEAEPDAFAELAVGVVAGRSVAVGELKRLAEVGVARPLLVDAVAWARWSEHVRAGGQFVAIRGGAAVPFVEQARAHFVATLPPRHRFTCRVVDPTGAPLRDVTVTLSAAPLPPFAPMAETLALAAAGTRALLRAVTGSDGVVQLDCFAEGEHHLEVSALGYARAEPVQWTVRVPQSEHVVVLHAIHVVAAELVDGELLSSRVEMPPSSNPPLTVRDVSRTLGHYREAFPAVVVVAHSQSPLISKATARLSALVRSGHQLRRIECDLPPRSVADAPTRIECSDAPVCAHGRARVDVFDAAGRSIVTRFSLLPDHDVTQGTIIARSGTELLLPIGSHRVRLPGSVLGQLAEPRTLTVGTGVAVLRFDLGAQLFRCTCELQPGGGEPLAGTSIRVRSRGFPAQMFGGDGSTNFGPFWCVRGGTEIDVVAAGFRPTTVSVPEPDAAGDPIVHVVIPLQPDD